MPFKFNPFSGNFDQTGSGGGGASYLDGEVEFFSDLPLSAATAPLDSAWLVRKPEGAWFLTKKHAGLYIRTATGGTDRNADYTYAGAGWPDVFSDANFLLYDNGDSTKNLQFQLSGISTGTTRTLTVPDANGTIARTEDFAAPPAIGSTTPSTGAFTTLSANNGTITASAPVLDLAQTWNNAAVTFTGLRFNVTNTASASASLLADFQVGGTSIVTITRDGVIGNANAGINVRETGSLNRLSFRSQGATRLLHNNSILLNESDGGYGWVTSGAPTSLGFDTGIFRGGAGIIEQRNGTNAQESRLYGTFTSSTNYQRMTIKSVRQTLSALSGASATTTGTFIPDGAVVVGVTTRVATALTGATGYTIGDGTDADRWGDITGTAIGTTSDNINWTAGTIECFTAGGNVTLTAKTANFTAGAIEVCVFYLAGEAD